MAGDEPDDRTAAFQPLRAVASLLSDFPGRWWIAGGWAIDLFAGRVTRPHEDVDVLILDRDQAAFHRACGEIGFTHKDHRTNAEREWLRDDQLTPGPDTLLLRGSRAGAKQLEILFARTDEDQWVYHRGRGLLRLPIADIGRSRDGIPYLVPQLNLLFKATDPRPQDHEDFHIVLDLLGEEERAWLRLRLERRGDHPWVAALRRGSEQKDH